MEGKHLTASALCPFATHSIEISATGSFRKWPKRLELTACRFMGWELLRQILITTAFLTCTSLDFLAARFFTTTATVHSPMLRTVRESTMPAGGLPARHGLTLTATVTWISL